MYAAGDPNLATMRQLSNKLVRTKFAEPWQFRVEIEGAPADWDLFCKEVVQTPIELETDQKRIGAHYLSFLNGAQPVGLSLTMRDDDDGQIYNWFEDWVAKVVYPDGTWGLPADYLRTCKIYKRKHDGSEYLRQELRVQPLTLGELTETVELGSGFLEFPITMVEFRGGSTQY